MNALDQTNTISIINILFFKFTYLTVIKKNQFAQNATKVLLTKTIKKSTNLLIFTEIMI